MKHTAITILLLFGALGLASTAAQAQLIIQGGKQQTGAVVDAPPSVDDGLANGDVKHAGAPSVGNGVANGVVKQPGAPSVDNGVANGSVKSSTINQ